MKPCTRRLDPLDVEAIAAEADPLCAADAAAHAAACAECGAAVDRARALGAELASCSALPEPPVSLTDRVVRLRGFSRRERLSAALWGWPAAFAGGVFGLGLALLRLPGLMAREQAGLGAAALLPAAGLFRSLSRWLSDLPRVLPSGLESLSSALRQEQSLGLAALLLFVPLAFGLKSVLARSRR